jgi:cytochrome c-type biogenesis protein CcmF
MPTTEAAIDAGFWRDLYVVIGDPDGQGGFITRLYYNPLVMWIWGGSVMMVLGGCLSFLGHRKIF